MGSATRWGKGLNSKKSMNQIPTSNQDLATMYNKYIIDQVVRLNRRSENTADICQSVWLRLVEANIVAKFHARAAKSRPEALTTEEVCLHLGIAVEDWTVAQSRYQAGDRTIAWMPAPIAGDPSSIDAIWSTDDVEQYAATVYNHHTKVSESEQLIPTPTVAEFRTYLQRSVHNAFANWCRTHHRRAKDRPIDFFVRRPSGPSVSVEMQDSDLFDLVGDTLSSTRRMTASVEAAEAIERCSLGERQGDFLSLLLDGYTAQEAAKKLKLSSATVQHLTRVLA